MKVTNTNSIINIRLASFLGQPANSFIFKRGSFIKFLLERKAIVAIKANTESISIKPTIKV